MHAWQTLLALPLRIASSPAHAVTLVALQLVLQAEETWQKRLLDVSLPAAVAKNQ
jgi:hypothetical protein